MINPITSHLSRKAGPLVIGLGNSILCDDTAGFVAVDRLEEEYAATFPEATFVRIENAGIELLDELQGHSHALFIDCVQTGAVPAGYCHEIEVDALQKLRSRLITSHGINLATTLELGRRMGYAMPQKVKILGIEGGCTTVFSQSPTPAVCDGIERCVLRACEILREWTCGEPARPAVVLR